MSATGAGTLRSVSTIRVRYAETDQMGIVYHPHYLVWCEIGRTDFIRQLDRSYAELERDGLLLAVAEARVRYHAAARYDDVVEVETRLEAVRSRGVTFAYEIVRAGETPERLATATVTLIATDRNGKTRTLPDDLLRAFREVVSPSL